MLVDGQAPGLNGRRLDCGVVGEQLGAYIRFMGLFWTDYLVICYSDVEAAKKWWISVFECKQTKIPADCDDPGPADVALKLPGAEEPTIQLCEKSDPKEDALARSERRPLLFTSQLKKAHDQLPRRGVAATPIEEGEGIEFFTVRDLDGNAIEICSES